MNPLISVLLPVRNGGRWLRLAVDSVLGQTWRELELLLIDDCSSDGAIEALPPAAVSASRARNCCSGAITARA